ncbi:MAG: hypothetical protein Q8W44_00450, partial [Candidatus Palauibacterales bacterium]|nr:hypothetical protein [Candidatus Palauibacterales bacterium]
WQQQTKSGGLTLDVTGAENYTSLYTVDESPVEEGVIWAGTDDGNLHVTRNGGESWTDVEDEMPDKPRHAWVSHVQASPHAAGTAYVAVHDYMRGDFSTYVYRTTDYGESWTRLPTDGVDGFARVVLEDSENPDLLWVGTEFGLFYSLDRGQSWEEWTHGFPRGTPVRDLALQDQAHEQDLVVGTFGRGIYVIDDLTALRAVADDPSLLHADLHLFEPNPALQHQQGSSTGYGNAGSTTYEGENEPQGVTLTVAAHVPDSLAEGGMEREAPDDTARFPYTEVESAPDTTPPVPTKEATFQVLRGDSVIQESELTLEEGLNRHTWDFDTEGAARFPRDMEELRQSLRGEEEDEELDGQGPAVLPGEFTARVVSHGDTAATSLEVRGDPRIDTPTSDRRAKRQMLREVAGLQGAAANAVESVRLARIRVNRAQETLADQEGLAESEADSLRQAGQTVIDSLKAVEEHWTGPLDSPQGISESESVLGKIGIAPFRFSSVAWYAPNEEERQRLEIARGAVSAAIERTNRVLETQVADFRTRVRDAGVELIPPVEPVSMPSDAGGM